MKAAHVFAVIIGVPAFVLFGFQTNWQTAAALFFILYANNLSQMK